MSKAPTWIVTQFPSLRDESVPGGKRNLQYLLLTRVRNYHPADDEVKQAYRINSKSFPVCWLAIPEELYGGCKGKRKWSCVNLVLSTVVVKCTESSLKHLHLECKKVENFMKRWTSCFLLPEYEDRVLWFYPQAQIPTLSEQDTACSRALSSVFHRLQMQLFFLYLKSPSILP